MPGAGLRLGVVRYLPRGVKKEDYRKLLEKRDKNLFTRYRSEILKNSESRCHRSVLAELLRAAGEGKLPLK